jgi:hypothetical protein
MATAAQYSGDVLADTFQVNGTGTTVLDNVTIGGTATVAETLTVTGSATFSSTVALNGAVTLAAALTNSAVTTLTGNTLATEAGTGITAGTGTVYASAVLREGGIFTTRLLIDLTGLDSEATDGDIIGVDGTSNPCHFGRITAAECGTVLGGRMTCIETPAGGDPNLMLYSATEATGTESDAIAGLTETLLLDRAGDWAQNDVYGVATPPAANEYLYIVQGDATGTAATYTAGKFLIEFFGYT